MSYPETHPGGDIAASWYGEGGLGLQLLGLVCPQEQASTCVPYA